MMSGFVTSMEWQVALDSAGQTDALPPDIVEVTPNTGTTAGGTPIQISGSRFTGVTGVTIGGAACTVVVLVNDSSITAVTPARTAGAKDIIVTTTRGSSTLPASFTYV